MRSKNLYPVCVYILMVVFVGCVSPPPGQPQADTEAPQLSAASEHEESSLPGSTSLTLATTTSTDDSGLLDFILPDFEAEYNLQVNVIAVGTGQALKLGEDGNVDVLLVHARAAEDAFMESGHGIRREDVMYNDFVIIGPPDDPAHIQGKSNAADAFRIIAAAGADFVSRGDNSGTHMKERSIWEKTQIEPSGEWYLSAGQGMGAVLTLADELQAYTLCDRATYLSRKMIGTRLEILVEGDPILFNPYGVIAVNPNKGDQIQSDAANNFIDWLVSLPTQKKISQFGKADGVTLFTPDSDAWRAVKASGTP